MRDAGISICCGGILGMGEQAEDRVGLLLQLANLPEHPDTNKDLALFERLGIKPLMMEQSVVEHA